MNKTEPTSGSPSRRDMVKAGAAGLLAAAPVAVLAAEPGGEAQPASATNLPEGAVLMNPVTEYPKPPFPKQQQEWPGLASKMDPRPDHGEKSYKGSGRLAGRKALITGGDSGIGRAVAIAFARGGGRGDQLPAR